MAYLGVDTGGTFTDFILFDETTGTVSIHKVLSTPDAPDRAIMQGLAYLNIDTTDLLLVHGSTVATNAVLEGKGVRTAYITNQGLADVLSIGRQARKELYNLQPEKKPPLIPPEHCLEVASRLSATGEALATMNDDDLQQLCQQIDAISPQAIAINLLFSFIDDAEEKRIEAAIVDRVSTQIFISRSSDVLPEYKEYERGITTTLNAYVGPLMQRYLQRLEQQAPGCHLAVMQSSAGTASAHHAGRYAVHLLLSGPAGGLKGAQFSAAKSDCDRLLSFDMGGTSTDVSIIDQEIGFTTEGHIGDYPVAVPMVDMHTIGAGGGSIASVDAGGLLLVGPESAGADPGPACYCKGGTRPTVTDANVILGRLLPDAFLGGRMILDRAKSEQALATIADKLDMSLHQAATGVIDVVNDHMVRALRVMSVQRGEDPKDYTLVSFGGAGGLHVCALADALQMTRALVPANAGVLSALGMLAAEPIRERSLTINLLLKDCNTVDIEEQFRQIHELAEQELREIAGDCDMQAQYSVDLRYKGQSYTLNLLWDVPEELEYAFHELHESQYGHRMAIEVELVNLRLRLAGDKPAFDLPEWRATAQAQQRMTTVYGFDQPVPILARDALKVDQIIDGPALITETTSTTWIDQGWQARVDRWGNLLLRTH
ncbi:MAG: hydantoinase/oxoprolinase family protein [Gammaproteobacteria bacterium]|nr:hydantoinase/oxoprolinase family protein [Gammaproteobacteria bacterium]NNJ98073.1 hydantoinase/oxoprolinase family protein [Gammaproteobacteria bacterium]